MILEIDGRSIRFAGDLHDKLIDCPGMPEFYGRNFYAFRDVLTGFIELPFKIIWRHASVSRANLGQDFESFALMMRQAVEETSLSERRFEFELID
jgi:RNAse (barnase) inhibitor barstar